MGLFDLFLFFKFFYISDYKELTVVNSDYGRYFFFIRNSKFSIQQNTTKKDFKQKSR